MVSALNVVSNLFVSPNPDYHAKMLIGPYLKKNLFASSALRDGDEDQTFPGEEGFFSISIDEGLDAIFRVIVTHAMARAPEMPGDAGDIALAMARKCPVIINTILESLSNCPAQFGTGFDCLVEEQKKHFSVIWSQGSTGVLNADQIRIVSAVSAVEADDEAKFFFCFHDIAESELWLAQEERLHAELAVLSAATSEHGKQEWLALYHEFVRAWGVHRTLPLTHNLAHKIRKSTPHPQAILLRMT